MAISSQPGVRSLPNSRGGAERNHRQRPPPLRRGVLRGPVDSDDHEQIRAGSPATLTASTVGIAPLAYEWYSVGGGNVLTPVGGNTAAITLAPSVTTTYLVRTQTRCGPPLDSAPVTVTVTAAPCD